MAMNEEKLVQFWMGEMERADKVVNFYWKPRWRKCRQAYRNHFYDRTTVEKAEIVERPLFYANVKVTVSNLCANPPVIMVDPQKEDFDKQALFVQAALKYDFERLDIFDKIRQAVNDMCVYNFTVAKVGYNFSESFNMPADSGFVGRVSPFNYFMEPEAVTQDEAPWEGEQRYVDFATLREEDGYFNLDKARALATQQIANKELTEVYAGDTVDPTKSVNNRNFFSQYPTIQPSKVKKLRIYEIYDKVNKKIIELAEGKIIIRYRDYPPYMEGSPYVIGIFNKTPDYFYGEPDYLIHETQYTEINRIVNRLVEYTRRMIPKILVNKNAIKSSKDIEKISKGELCEVIPVDTTMPLDQMYKMIFEGNIDPTNFNVLAEIKSEIDQDTGIADFMRGSNPGKGTATQASMAAAGATSRAAERLHIVEKFTENIAKKLFYIRKHMTTAEEWIGIQGVYPVFSIPAQQVEMQKMRGFTLTPQMLQADLRIKIEAGSMALNNFIQKQQMALNMYSVVVQNPIVDKVKLTKFLLRHYDGVDPDDFMMEQPPMAMPPGMPGQDQGQPPQDMSAPGAVQSGVNPSSMPGPNQMAGHVERNINNTLMSAGNPNMF